MENFQGAREFGVDTLGGFVYEVTKLEMTLVGNVVKRLRGKKSDVSEQSRAVRRQV
jgi:hypothetical protein